MSVMLRTTTWSLPRRVTSARHGLEGARHNPRGELGTPVGLGLVAWGDAVGDCTVPVRLVDPHPTVIRAAMPTAAQFLIAPIAIVVPNSLGADRLRHLWIVSVPSLHS